MKLSVTALLFTALLSASSLSQDTSPGRTMALDAVKETLVKQEIFFPKNIESIPDFVAHMTSSTRVYDEKKDGRKEVFKQE